MMNLDARASAASTGVEQIRSQQQAQGFDIRGDVLASMNRLNNFMKEADRALSQHDLQPGAARDRAGLDRGLPELLAGLEPR